MALGSRWNWNLEVLDFVEGGKPENPEKNPRSKDENQQQTQPTYDAKSSYRTRVTLVGGERSHHCSPFEIVTEDDIDNNCSKSSVEALLVVIIQVL